MKNKMRFFLFIVMSAMMVFVSCSQDASGDSDDSADEKPKPTVPADPPVTETPPSAAPSGPYTLSEGTLSEATSATVVGTWVQTAKNADGSLVATVTWVFDAALGYTKIVENTIVQSGGKTVMQWNGERGTYEIADGVLTSYIAFSGKSDSSLYDPATAEWKNDIVPFYHKQSIAFIDGKLCVNAFRRVGAGTGIEGNWEAVTSSEYPSIPVLTKFNKFADTFGKTGYTKKSGESKTATFDSITWSPSESGTYTIGAGNTMTLTGPGPAYTMDVLISGNGLYYGPGGTKKP